MWSELAVFWYILNMVPPTVGGAGGGGGRRRPQSGGGRGRRRSWDPRDGLGAARHSASMGRDWAGGGGGGDASCICSGLFFMVLG